MKALAEVGELELGVFTYRCLVAAAGEYPWNEGGRDIRTVDGLRSLREAELLRIPGIGIKRRDEIWRAIAAYDAARGNP